MAEAGHEGDNFSALRAALQPLNLDQPAALPQLDDYLALYQFDFSKAFPELRYSIGTVASRRQSLAVQCWQQPDAARTLLIVHGYYDHVGLFRHLVRYGLERGYNVVAFDQAGHGLSTGEPAVIDDFSDYAQAIRDIRAAIDRAWTWDVVAQSTGCAAVMDVLTRPDPPPFAHVVLLAPLIRPRGWWWIAPAHSLLHKRRDSLARGYAENSHDPVFLDFVRRDPLQARIVSVRWIGALKRWIADFVRRPASPQRLLVIQGDEDGTVAWRYNLRQVARLFPNASVFLLPEGRHHLPNESEALRAVIFEQCDAYLGVA